MIKRTARALATQIEHDDPHCAVTGMRRFERYYHSTGRAYYYGLDVIDHRTGTRFVIWSPDQWSDRLDEQREGSTLQ